MKKFIIFLFFILNDCGTMTKNNKLINDKKNYKKNNSLNSPDTSKENNTESSPLVEYKTNLQSLTQNDEEFEHKSIEEIIDELEILIDDLKEDIVLPDGYFKNFKENKLKESIESVRNQIMHRGISLDDLSQLHFKSIRLSMEYLKKDIESKKNTINLLNLLNSVSYDFSINFKDTSNLKWEYIKKENNQRVNISFNGLIHYLGDIFIIYVNFLKIEMEKLEIENKLFGQLINLINNYINTKLILIKLFIKLNYSHRQLKYFIAQKENFNEEQILREIQKFYKTMNKIVQYLENCQDYAIKIKKLTGEPMGNVFFWNLEDDSNKFFYGSMKNMVEVEKIINTFKTENLNDKNYEKLLDQILNKNINYSLQKFSIIKLLNTIFIKTKLNKKNIKNLIRKKSFINYFNSFINLIKVDLNIDVAGLSQKSPSKITASTSTKKISNFIFQNITNYYNNKEEIFSIEEKSRNLFFEIFQIIKELEIIQKKQDYLKKKIRLHQEKFNNDNLKTGYIIKQHEVEDILIKILNMKNFNELIENNNEKMKYLHINYIYGYIKTKKELFKKKN
jgi:hypothetical protein